MSRYLEIELLNELHEFSPRKMRKRTWNGMDGPDKVDKSTPPERDRDIGAKV